MGKLEIFQAIRPGTRRCRGQREHRRAGYMIIDGQPWHSQRKAHYKAIFKRLSAHMDWDDRTARPTHEILRGPHRPGCPGPPHRPGCHRPLAGCRCGERCGCPGRVSSDTVRRAVGWFREAGLLGLVSPGVRADMRSFLHTAEGNLAAVYVCTVPRRHKRQIPRVDAGQREIAAPPVSCKDTGTAPRASRSKTPEMDRPPGGQPLLPRRRDPLLHAAPKTRSEGLAAAAAIQDRAAWLRDLSPETVRRLGRRFWAAGRPWTPADVLHALDYETGGRPHGYRDTVRHPAAWARTRLAQWLGPDGQPLPSASQVRADRAAHDKAEQDTRRRQAAEAAARAADAAAAGLGDAARAAMAAASPAAARALERARLRAGDRARPSRPPARPTPGGLDEALHSPAALRQALLARLDGDARIRAQRHRAATAARLPGPAREDRGSGAVQPPSAGWPRVIPAESPGATRASYSCVVSTGLPPGISGILEYLAQMASGYGNRLKWNEVAKLKADLMNVPARWRGVPVSEIADYCRALGMRDEDVATVADLVRKAQEGRRLVPQKTYRNFRFQQAID